MYKIPDRLNRNEKIVLTVNYTINTFGMTLFQIITHKKRIKDGYYGLPPNIVGIHNEKLIKTKG